MMAVKTNYNKNGIDYYRVTLTIGRDSNGKVIRKEFYGKSKKEAETKRDAYKLDLKNGINKNAGDETVNNAFKAWLFEVILPSGIKASTFETYESIYRLYVKDSSLGIKKISNVKSIMVQTFFNELSQKGKNYPLLSKIYKLIKRFFNYQVDTDAIMKNPCSSVKIPGQIAYLQEKNVKEIEVITLNERDIILKYLFETKSRIAGMAYLAFSLGMREGEILALSWDDIDLKNRVMHIKKSVRKSKNFSTDGSVIDKTVKITVPKTLSSVRDIEYPSSFDKMWELAKLQNKIDKLKSGSSYNNKNNLVFTDELGNPLDKRFVIRHWRKALDTLEIKYRTFHQIRHTFVTQMALDNIPESVTQSIVGHKKGSEITDKIYTHVNKESTKKALEMYKINVPKF
ncbi:site-specific integrase [Clostridium sp. YIM B02551]|uniref:tyrosine-type recombinase/integrase n=1 Tax=Clostridium sp. YIM B02551 TaxID=2910679 RepID=UPI001EEC0B8C|nr:site-specific integrase [Clostridium sp. YIM B02551]